MKVEREREREREREKERERESERERERERGSEREALLGNNVHDGGSWARSGVCSCEPVYTYMHMNSIFI